MYAFGIYVVTITIRIYLNAMVLFIYLLLAFKLWYFLFQFTTLKYLQIIYFTV